MKITTDGISTEVGKEWYPYNSIEFLGNSLVACVAMVAGYIGFDPVRSQARAPFVVLPDLCHGADVDDGRLETVC